LGKDVNMGEITINFFAKGCKEAVCGPKKRALPEDTPRTLVIRTVDAEIPIDTSLPADTSDNPQAADALLGINCKGSGMCPACNMGTNEAIYSMNQIRDDHFFPNGQQILCRACNNCNPDLAGCVPGAEPGLCVFPQKMKIGEIISGKTVKDALAAVKAHNCKRKFGSEIDLGGRRLTISRLRQCSHSSRQRRQHWRDYGEKCVERLRQWRLQVVCKYLTG
jgi:hypothetical protein